MRRILKISALAAGALVMLAAVLAGAVLVAGNSDSGRALIERVTYRLTAGTVKLTGLAGSLPTQLTLVELQLIDRGGVWLTADRIALTWSPLRLLERRIRVETLKVERLHMERAPQSDGKGGSVSVPYIDVRQFSVDTLELGAPLTGTAATLGVHGSVLLRSLENANADVVARRLDGEGEYTLHLRFDPKRMDASLAVHEPASGPLENLLSLPGLGALSATVTLAGPRAAEVVDVALAAGELKARVQGRVNLQQASADLDYSLTAAAMAPRSDLEWSAVSLHGSWHGPLSAPQAAGRLEVDGLRIAGSTKIARLTADLSTDAGRLSARAVVAGIEIPGPQPRFFASDPLKLDASLKLNDASRPLDVTAAHPLASLRARLVTAPDKTGRRTATIELKVPDLAPLAAFTHQDVRGNALVNGEWAHSADDDSLKLDAKAALTGGTAAWLGVVGPKVTLQFAGGLGGARVTVDSLRVAGRAFTFTSSGSAARGAPAPIGTKPDARGPAERFVKELQARWQLEVSDLAQFSSDVAGDLKASGRLTGAPASLMGDAEATSRLSVRGSPSGTVQATLHARGLPAAPSGTIEAHGLLDESPLSLDASVERSGSDAFRLLIRRATWKSAEVDGDLTADAALTASHGQLKLRIGSLRDLDRLTGINLTGSAQGSIGFVPSQGHTEAQLSVDGSDLVVGQFGGNVHVRAHGVTDALAMQVSAELPDLYGMPAALTSAAELNIGARELRLDNASIGYRGETLRLLGPARLSFARGFMVDDLKLGAQGAVFELKGQVTPLLDLRASLRGVDPQLINLFSPGLLTGGTLDAQTRLEGSLSSPTGRARIDATGIRFADDAATGLPALDLHARAQLADNAAIVTATLGAGTGSQLTADGSVPLNANGALDLKLGGTLTVALANPFLEARGMHAGGELTVEATVTGSTAAPQVGGGFTLAQGGFRDYVRGVNLSDVSAEVVGREGALQIKSFKATAVTGTVGMTGTFGLLQPKWPVDLKVTAKNAQPVASNIVTANVDADLHVAGTARERLDVAGTIHVNRATIGIPNSLPPDVAVLDVRRRGKIVQVDAARQLVIGLDIAIQAPQEVLVQGRGLDAEMGGEIQLSGTTDALLASGGFNLLRGTFTLVGNRLTFKEGRVGFDGAGLRKKIDPTLDFTAETVLANNTTATLHISGVADAPLFDFKSSTDVPQDEIMAQLLFGENAAQVSALQAAQIAAALATLSGVGGGGLNPLVKLQKTLGLDRLTVGTNTTNTVTGPQNSGAAIAAGRYVSKRVYVEGKQTTTGTSQVQVDVDLTKHLKLQTRLGNGTAITQGTTPENDPGSSIGLSYGFEY